MDPPNPKKHKASEYAKLQQEHEAAEKAAAEANAKMLAAAEEWLNNLTPRDIVNEKYFEDATQEEMKAAFRKETPFPYYVMKDVMDDSFLKRVKEELMEEEFIEKHNDLYTFAQTSKDLGSTTKPLLGKLRDTLYSEEFRAMLEKVTGIETTGEQAGNDMFGAIYENTHTLLCHDDELRGRRIAYILYMPEEDWCAEDGGTLDLFDVRADGEPRDVVKRLVPAWNSFIFFEVSNVSFHMVAEVLKENRTRASIGGWFHGKPFERKPVAVDVLLPEDSITCEPVPNWEPTKVVKEWVNANYCKPALAKQVREQFEDASMLALNDFLLPAKYAALMKELQALQVLKQQPDSVSTKKAAGHKEEGWMLAYPPNKRRFLRYQEPTGPSKSVVLAEFRQFLLSADFAHLLNYLCSLHVVQGSVDVRKFRAGDYTLNFDNNPETATPGLDASFICLPSDVSWPETGGGATVYLQENEAEPLAQIDPVPNTLSLVYRAAPGTMCFTQYVNHTVPTPLMAVRCVYRCLDEVEEEEEEAAE